MHPNESWLKKELINTLGFPEVDDIVAYILTSFKTKKQVEEYLTDLLGISSSRAHTISYRLFRSSPKKIDKSQSPPQQKAQSLSTPTALVSPPVAINSRIKVSKRNPKTKQNRSHVINCMYCGKIEHSGSSKCSFCESTLYYQELDTDMLDSMVLTDLKRKVLGANVSLEKENEVVGHCAYLSKEARDLYEGINRHIDKEKNHYGSDKNSLKVHINQNAIIEDDFR